MRIVPFIVLGITALLLGCAGSAGYRVEPGYYPYPYAGYGYSDGSIRTTACQPFRADSLVSWAKELDTNKHHSRTADVHVRNDRVDCSQQERAGSQMGNPTNGIMKNYRRY